MSMHVTDQTALADLPSLPALDDVPRGGTPACLFTILILYR